MKKLLIALLFIGAVKGDRPPPRTNKQILWDSFKQWRRQYDAQADPGAKKADEAYPRLWNQFYFAEGGLVDTAWVHEGQTINLRDSLALALSKWDWVNVEYHRENTPEQIKRVTAFHDKIKEFNPDVHLLLYFLAGQNPRQSRKHIKQMVAKRASTRGWWITDTRERCVAGSDCLLDFRKKECREWMAGEIRRYMKLSWDNYDGVRLDLVRGANVLKLWARNNKIDMNKNGKDDRKEWGLPAVVDSLQYNYVLFLKVLRDSLGPDKIIITNPGTPYGTGGGRGPGGWKVDSLLFAHVNGNEVQGVEKLEDTIELGIMGSIYTNKHADPTPGTLFLAEWIDPHDDCDVRSMVQRRRYYLTAMTMVDAYSDFVMGGDLLKDCTPARNFNQLWWIPEYNLDLGGAKGILQKAESEKGREYFYRDFEKGFAVLNRNAKDIRVKLPRNLKDVHTGKIVHSVTVPAKDGMILIDLDTE